MPFFNLFKQASKSHVADATDDISQVEIRTEAKKPTNLNPSSTTSNVEQEPPEVIETEPKEIIEHVGVYFGKTGVDLPLELMLHIGGFMHVGEVREMALCNSKLNMLFFNVKKEEIGLKRDYEKEDEIIDFERVQQLIWKPLVFAYYPKFEKQLNIKNWMHLLRRRLQHVKLHGTSHKLDIPSFVNSEKDEEIIENCEWVYKCPLNYNDLGFSMLPGERHCNVCNKQVVKVDSMESFVANTKQGNCIAFTYKPISYFPEIALQPIMGSCVRYDWELELEIQNLGLGLEPVSLDLPVPKK